MRIVTAAALAAAIALPVPAAWAETTLRAGHFIGAPKSLYRTTFAQWQERVNAEGEGLVQIGQVVGPEAIARDQWCNAVSSGLLDVAVVAFSYCNNLVPIAEGLNAQTKTPAELRENGAYEFLREVYADANIYFLGQYGWGGAHHIFVSKPVETAADLDGLRMRSTPTLRRFYDKLGVEGHAMGLGDTYTALERGVIDGFALPHNMIKALGLQDIVTHRVSPGVYNPGIMVLVNLDTWNGMSDEEREFLTRMAAVLEDEIDADFRENNDAMGRELTEEFGIVDVVLEDEDGETLRAMANEGVWEAIAESAPEDGAKLRGLIAD